VALFLGVSIVRWISDEPQPGWIEAHLVDAWGKEWTFEDKPYIFAGDREVSAHSTHPQPGVIRCEIVKHWRDAGDREFVTVDTELPCHVESTTGQTRFDVVSEQLVMDLNCKNCQDIWLSFRRLPVIE